MAWLNAVPKEKEVSRRQDYVPGSPQLDMIELSEYEYHIITLWTECGTVAQGAGGLLPLEWTSIVAWANQFYSEDLVEWLEHPRDCKRHKRVYTPIVTRHCVLFDSELNLIRTLSQEYSSEYAAASDPARACPKEIFAEDIPEEVVEANSNAIMDNAKSLFGG